ASLKNHRYSNYAMESLVRNRYKVVAMGSAKGKVAGITIETEFLQHDDIDTITIYLNSKRQKTFYDYIISLNPNRVIFNPGTENPELYAILKEKNIAFEESCTLVLLSTDQY
ncbi:MAG: CoA-binding protein, partial [Bacteroidia bacterium]|nr:CoA-binding protein [Bacteroidia bacterium]